MIKSSKSRPWAMRTLVTSAAAALFVSLLSPLAASASTGLASCDDVSSGASAAFTNAALQQAFAVRGALPASVVPGEGVQSQVGDPCAGVLSVRDSGGNYLLLLMHTADPMVANAAIITPETTTSSHAALFSLTSTVGGIASTPSGSTNLSSPELAAALVASGPSETICNLSIGLFFSVMEKVFEICKTPQCAGVVFLAGFGLGLAVCGPGVQNIHLTPSCNICSPGAPAEALQDSGVGLDVTDAHYYSSKGFCLITETGQCYGFSPSRNAFEPATMRWAAVDYIPYVNPSMVYNTSSRSPTNSGGLVGNFYYGINAARPGNYDVHMALTDQSVCPDNEPSSPTMPSGCTAGGIPGGQVSRTYAYT